VSDGKAFSGLNEITEGFNDFFVNVGPKLASSIPSTNNFFQNIYLILLNKTSFLQM